MRKPFLSLLPFLVALLFALGCVVVSCSTDPRVARGPGTAEVRDLNTGAGPDGRVFTSEVFSSVRSVIVFDSDDRSRRVELKEGEWEYDRETTELTILKSVPFKDPLVHVEGVSCVPRTFVLTYYSSGGDVLVVLGDRAAVEGLEYTLSGNRLTFREDLDIETLKYHVSYQTEYGATSFGNLAVWEDDRFAYLEAERREKRIKESYARLQEDYFLEASPVPGAPPVVVRRPPTPEERKAVEDQPPVVFKMRMNASDAELSKELGFRVSLPAEVGGCRRWSAMIEEESREGRLGLHLTVLYRRTDRGKYDPAATLQLGVRKAGEAPAEERRGAFLVSERTLDLGVPVRERRDWGLLTSSPNGEPDVVLMCSYEWEEEGALYSLVADASESDFYEAFIRTWLAARK